MHGKCVRKEKGKKKIASLTKSAKSTTVNKPAKSSTDSRPAKSSADIKIEVLDQKWSERFNRLQTLLLARTLEKPQEPTLQTVNMALTNIPPAGAVKSADPWARLPSKRSL